MQTVIREASAEGSLVVQRHTNTVRVGGVSSIVIDMYSSSKGREE